MTNDASIAAREQYLDRVRRLDDEVARGEINEYEAAGIALYLRKAIRAETINPIARRYGANYYSRRDNR